MSIRSALSRIYYSDATSSSTASHPSCRCCQTLRSQVVAIENEKLDLKLQLQAAAKQIAELKTQLGEQSQKAIDLEKKRAKNRTKPLGSNTPSSKETFKEGASKESQKKQGGAKVGHRGHGRKKFTDEEINRSETPTLAATCPCCMSSAIKVFDRGDRDLIDLNLEQIEKLRLRLLQGECLVCGTEVKPEVSALPRSLFSNSVMSKIIVDHFYHGITLGTVLGQLKLGDKLSAVLGAMHRIAKISESSYDKIIQDYRACEIRHADETGWRTDGKNGYAWGFFAKGVSIFVVGVNRSAATVRRILGEVAIGGVLVVDRYSGYNQAPCALQYCFSHLDRDVLSDGEEFDSEPSVVEFSSALSNLLKESMVLRRKAVDDKTYYEEAVRLKSEFLAMGYQKIAGEHLCIQTWRKFIIDNEKRLFHWVNDRRIPAENNTAERELRRLVISRKVSFGSQSDKGAKTREIMMTLLHTAKKRLAPNEDLSVWLKNALDDYSSGRIDNLYDALAALEPE